MGNRSIVYSVQKSPSSEGESSVYTNPSGSASLPDKGIFTLKDLLLRALLLFPDQVHLTSRNIKGEYVAKTIRQEVDIAVQIGSGIKNLNLSQHITDEFDRDFETIGVLSKNREEWILLDMAAMLFGFTVVPFHENFSIENICHVLQLSEISTLFISGEKARELLKTREFHQLKNLIILDDLDSETVKLFVSRKLRVLSWEQVREVGLNYPCSELGKISRERIQTFCFTSGSSGKPKAAMLSHGNFIASLSASYGFYKKLGITRGNRHLSYLPLSHIYERSNIIVTLYFGMQVFLYSGDVTKLKKDILDSKPHTFVSVPRIYNKIYDTVMATVNAFKGIQSLIIQRAIKTKLYNLKNFGLYTHGIYDKIIFNKLRDSIMGGDVSCLSCGSAPLSENVSNMMKIVFSCPLVEGYGQSETTGPIFLTDANDPTTGVIGGPVQSCEFKTVDLPESGRFTSDKNRRGELLVRGPFVFKGYFRDRIKTDETITKEGWLKTGDVVTLLPNGCVKIIDRKNNIFKLSQGEYVAPEVLEVKYLACQYVSEIWITGDSLENYLVAVVVPNKELIMNYAKAKDLHGNFEELCEKNELKKFILNQLNKVADEQKLLGFERIKEIHLEPVSMVVNGVCTPTMKIKRKECKKLYSSVVKQMYKKVKSVLQDDS